MIKNSSMFNLESYEVESTIVCLKVELTCKDSVRGVTIYKGRGGWGSTVECMCGRSSS